MSADMPLACCPKCGGTQGYEFTQRVDHRMQALAWDEEAEMVYSGLTTVSLAECLDCGGKVRLSTIEAWRKVQP